MHQKGYKNNSLSAPSRLAKKFYQHLEIENAFLAQAIYKSLMGFLFLFRELNGEMSLEFTSFDDSRFFEDRNFISHINILMVLEG